MTAPQRDCPAPVAVTRSARRVSTPVAGLVERGGDVRGCPDRFRREKWTSGTATDVSANVRRAGQRLGVMRPLLPAHPGPCQSPQGTANNPGQVRLRENGSGWVGIKFSSSSLILYQSSGAVTLDTESITTDTDAWYEYYAVCDGSNIEVWRRKKGTTDAMTKILETTSTTQTAAGYLTFASGTGNFLTDISLLELDGDVLKNEIFVYNASNELTSQTVGGTATNFTYDQFGRITQVVRRQRRIVKATGTYLGCGPATGDKLTKVASVVRRQRRIVEAAGVQLGCGPATGGQKRRSRAVSGGDTIKYRYDQGWGVLNEEDGSGNLEVTYVHSPVRQIGTVLATLEGSTASSGTWSYYFQDAIGFTRGLWDNDGERIGKYDYTPFGGKLAESGVEITHKFTGHDWDNDARLYYTAYRYYSPDANRWLTRDPLGMHDGPNVYSYVMNNPVARADTDGRLIFLPLLFVLGLDSSNSIFRSSVVLRYGAIRWDSCWKCNLPQRYLQL